MMLTPIMRLPVWLEQVYLVINDLAYGLVFLLGLLSRGSMVRAGRSHVTILADDRSIVWLESPWLLVEEVLIDHAEAGRRSVTISAALHLNVKLRRGNAIVHSILAAILRKQHVKVALDLLILNRRGSSTELLVAERDRLLVWAWTALAAELLLQQMLLNTLGITPNNDILSRSWWDQNLSVLYGLPILVLVRCV